MPRKSTATKYREVKPTEPDEREEPRLNKSACRWMKKDLDLLGVEYQFGRFEDDLLGVEDRDLPREFVEGMKPIFYGD